MGLPLEFEGELSSEINWSQNCYSNFTPTVTSAERTSSPEEVTPESRVEPEPVFIDEVRRFFSSVHVHL